MRVAAELCLRTGQIDVMGFMESVDPQVLDFWEVYDSMFPLNQNDPEMLRHAGLMAMIQRFMAMFSSAHGVSMELMHDNDFLPKRLHYKIDKKMDSASSIQSKVTSGLRLVQ